MGSPKGPKVRVKVTEELIQADIAKPRHSGHCMIAEALQADYPAARCVSVDLATIRFTDPERGLRFTYLTPRVAQVALVNFDQGTKPEPFSFQLRGPHVTRSGNTKPPKRVMTDKERRQRAEAGRKLSEKMRRTKMVDRTRGNGTVPERVGGKTPPLQTSKDNVPFTRRRAFGLRGLEY